MLNKLLEMERSADSCYLMRASKYEDWNTDPWACELVFKDQSGMKVNIAVRGASPEMVVDLAYDQYDRLIRGLPEMVRLIEHRPEEL